MDKIATTLALQKAINRKLDDLIKAATKNVALLEPPPTKTTKMEKSQIRNLVNVAAATESLEEVTNFIRYQIGRNDVWATFGQAVIKDIESGIIQTVLKAVTEEVPTADPIKARAEIISRYLGYLNRRFVYAEKTKDWSDGASASI